MLEASLWGAGPFGCDIQPLAFSPHRPRINPPKRSSGRETCARCFHSAAEFHEDLIVCDPPEPESIARSKQFLARRAVQNRRFPLTDGSACSRSNSLTGTFNVVLFRSIPCRRQAVLRQVPAQNQLRTQQTRPSRHVVPSSTRKPQFSSARCGFTLRKSSMKSLHHVIAPDQPALANAANSVPTHVRWQSPRRPSAGVDYAGDNWLRAGSSA